MSPTNKAATSKAATKKAAKKPAVKKAPAKRPVARKAASKKPVAKKPVAKKAAAKPKQSPVCVPTNDSVDAHIGAIADPGRRQDCRTLVEVFRDATGRQPKMWGGSIVAFGKYHYKYASGHEGDSCLAGFASRKGALTLYLSPEDANREPLLRKLGKHREGKGCVYLKNLDDVDLQVLGELVKSSADNIRRKYPVQD